MGLNGSTSRWMGLRLGVQTGELRAFVEMHLDPPSGPSGLVGGRRASACTIKGSGRRGDVVLASVPGQYGGHNWTIQVL